VAWARRSRLCPASRAIRYMLDSEHQYRPSSSSRAHTCGIARSSRGAAGQPAVRGPPLSANSVVTRVVTVAGGRFGPGHLGELTRIVPFQMVDAVLGETGKVLARIRDLPSRVVVYLLLAAGLFAEVGYGQVWAKMISGLDGLGVVTPTAGALAQARRRIGVAPLRALFDLLRGPGAGPRTKGVYWRGR
ncbi:MAG: transposase domain-containing protein, partial [Pseudonocardiaceae bacterium]